jgi:hypothetical protein
MESHNFELLKAHILPLSVSDRFDVARLEWDLVDVEMICPLLSGPKSLLFWIMKEFENGQEAQARRDYRQAA